MALTRLLITLEPPPDSSAEPVAHDLELEPGEVRSIMVLVAEMLAEDWSAHITRLPLEAAP